MIVQPFPSGPFETNAYVVACTETRKAAIVDPAPDSADAVSKFLEDKQLKPVAILITHSHWDHIGDTAKLKAKYHAPVYIHSLDVPNLRQPGADGLPCWIAIEGVLPDKFMDEGDIVAIGALHFEVIHTPGHTPGGVSLYCAQEIGRASCRERVY